MPKPTLSRASRTAATLASAGLLLVSVVGAASPSAFKDDRGGDDHGVRRTDHVLLISVDGLHESDLLWYSDTHPSSALAQLVRGGDNFTHALSPVPSDSFPGMVGQTTGGNPQTTGVYYDDTWNHAVYPSAANGGTCSGPLGGEVPYMEALDKNPNSIDAGQGIGSNPGPNLTNSFQDDSRTTPSQVPILGLSKDPRTLIDPNQLPVNPAGCTPIWPNQYLKTNTVFEVARAAGLRTAWSDKHPAYEILDGPSGAGVQDFFTPEINSLAPAVYGGGDWASNNAATRQYDSYKVQAVVNEILGYDHSGRQGVGTPAIFGLNFQTVSTAQKLPQSQAVANGPQLPGGYLADGRTPGPLLSSALDFVNFKVSLLMAAISERNLWNSTTMILSAKHGQSPMRLAALNRIDDGVVLGDLNAAWAKTHPNNKSLAVFGVDDDGMLVWLSDRSPAALKFATDFLWDYSNGAASVDGKPVAHAGLTSIFPGAAAEHYFNAPVGNPRTPDIFGIAQYGVVYTSHQGKIAEHGGAHLEDRNVALVIFGSGVRHQAVDDRWVETTQIAPTILRLLGLNPRALTAVREEGTASLLR